jgi:hypothetical protein
MGRRSGRRSWSESLIGDPAGRRRAGPAGGGRLGFGVRVCLRARGGGRGRSRAVSARGPGRAARRSARMWPTASPFDRCSVTRRANRAMRAGMLMILARIVAVSAFESAPPARTPSARVRVNAMAAQTSQAALAVNRPEGRWASPEALRWAKTCSTIACPQTSRPREGPATSQQATGRFCSRSRSPHPSLSWAWATVCGCIWNGRASSGCGVQGGHRGTMLNSLEVREVGPIHCRGRRRS